MWARRYWSNTYFAPRYWANTGGTDTPVTGGVVWVWVDGVSTPPGTTSQGTQQVWMCVNGAWVIPVVKTMPWPRRARADDRH